MGAAIAPGDDVEVGWIDVVEVVLWAVAPLGVEAEAVGGGAGALTGNCELVHGDLRAVRHLRRVIAQDHGARHGAGDRFGGSLRLGVLRELHVGLRDVAHRGGITHANEVEAERGERPAVSAAWLLAPVPLKTETDTDDGAGSAVPVMESVVAPMPRSWSTAAWSCGLGRELDVAIASALEDESRFHRSRWGRRRLEPGG